MEQGDNRYRPRSASRPPETQRAGDDPLFTEIPLNNARRTAPSGRPDYARYQPAPGNSAQGR